MHGARGASTAAEPGAGVALRRFAAGMRRRHVCGRALGALLRWGLLLAPPTVAVAWLRPAWTAGALQLALALLLPIVAFAAVRAWWRSRGVL
ncbi:MAG: hypothetical protein KAI24_12635, partial [Planctomycetes bacterium]|nr:hypothetical protein [Planctomycetota bacterium]